MTATAMVLWMAMGATPAELPGTPLEAPIRLELAQSVEEALETLSEERAATVRARLEALRDDPRPAGAVEDEEGRLELEWSDLGLTVIYRSGAEALEIVEILEIVSPGSLLVESLGASGPPASEPDTSPRSDDPPETFSQPLRYGWQPPTPSSAAGSSYYESPRVAISGLRYWKTLLLLDLLTLPVGLWLFASPIAHWVRYHRPGAGVGSFLFRWLVPAALGLAGSFFGLGGVLIGVGVGMVVAMILDYSLLARASVLSTRRAPGRRPRELSPGFDRDRTILVLRTHLSRR